MGPSEGGSSISPSTDTHRALLAKAPGVELRDDVERSTYPMPLTATAKYDVEVSQSVSCSLLRGVFHALEPERRPSASQAPS